MGVCWRALGIDPQSNLSIYGFHPGAVACEFGA